MGIESGFCENGIFHWILLENYQQMALEKSKCRAKRNKQLLSRLPQRHRESTKGKYKPELYLSSEQLLHKLILNGGPT